MLVKAKADYEGLQDFHKLAEWETMWWQMKFSVSKCKVMYTGTKKNPNKYKLMGSELAETQRSHGG